MDVTVTFIVLPLTPFYGLGLEQVASDSILASCISHQWMTNF